MLAFLFTNAAIGAALGIVLAAALVLSNTAGLLDLIRETSEPLVPLLLILVGFATSFGGLYVAGAVMLIEREDRRR